MSEQPIGPPAPGGKKIFGLPRRTFFIIIGVGAVAGIGWYLWKRNQASQASSSATTGNTSTDTSGQLSTLQTELEQLLQDQGASAGAGSGGGGGGYWYNGGGTSGTGTGDTGSSGSTSTTSAGGTNGAGSTTVTPAPPVTVTTPAPTQPAPVYNPPPAAPQAPAAAPAPSNGRVLVNGGHQAVLAWNGNGAAYWVISIVGPGPLNGHVNRVNSPQASYWGVEPGHNYETRITPYTANGTPGPVGGIDFKANP